jgi:uncharacterized membrane protein required for colicin V production
MGWFLDALAVFFMAGLGIIGYKRGLIEELGRLLGLILAVAFGFKYYVSVSTALLKFLSFDGTVMLVLSFAIIFISTLIAVRIITRMVHILMMSSGTKWMNRSMGFAFGFLKGGLVLTALLWMTELFPDSGWSGLILNESRLAESMQKTRHTLIKTFHWEDPVKKGKSFIASVIEDNLETTQTENP